MKIYPEHELEAAPGLPEPLPPGERLLWQGRPDWRQLARDAFHVDAIGVYFALMILLQALLSWRASDSLTTNLMPLLTSAALALVALGLLLLSAWLQPVRPVRPVMAPMEARAAQPSMWRRVAQPHWGW